MINVEKQYKAFVALRKFINEADDVVSSLPGRQDIKTAAIDLRNAARLILLKTLNEYEELREAYLAGKEKEWLIWSEEHDAWWRPDHSGYTVHRESAGLYTFAEAIKICKGANYGCECRGDKNSEDRRGRGGNNWRPLEMMIRSDCYSHIKEAA